MANYRNRNRRDLSQFTSRGDLDDLEEVYFIISTMEGREVCYSVSSNFMPKPRGWRLVEYTHTLDRNGAFSRLGEMRKYGHRRWERAEANGAQRAWSERRAQQAAIHKAYLSWRRRHGDEVPFNWRQNSRLTRWGAPTS